MPVWLIQLLQIILAPIIKDWVTDALKGDKVGLKQQRRVIDRALAKEDLPKKHVKMLEIGKKNIEKELSRCQKI